MTVPKTSSRTNRTDRPWWILLILLPGVWALLARPLIPLEETRAVGVAWEMWLRNDFLVPYMNGAPYSHKPPLLFWLIHLGWSLFGVSDWWPKIVGPLVTFVATVLTWRLAGEMRPDDHRFRTLTAWLMAGSLGWIFYGQMLMYDALLTACVLLGLLGVWRAGATRTTAGGWLLIAAGLGLGVLAKGPVALVHILPVLLLGPVWSETARARPGGWYLKSILALLGGLLIAGIWAGLAATLGGDEYARAILLEQTSGRVVNSFAHQRPWWVYLVFAPALVLPWALMPDSWRALGRDNSKPERRFLLCWALGSLFVLSLVSGKQPHYAVPELPAIALLIAGGLSATYTARRVAGRAIASVVVLLAIATVLFIPMHGYNEYDMTPPGKLAAALQRAGTPVATTPSYKNQLAFPGRLEQPLITLERSDMAHWLRQNPDGVIVTFKEKLPDSLALQAFERFPYRRGEIEFLRRKEGAP